MRVSQVRKKRSSRSFARFSHAFSTASCSASWQSASFRRIDQATRYIMSVQASISAIKNPLSTASAPRFVTLHILDSQISIQNPLSHDWFDAPIAHSHPYNESIEPDYKDYFPPMVARRLGRLLKRAVVTARHALNGIMPDAIITGTGLGCIENTERFLTSMLENDEEYLQPTYFMQSTHNTIGSQVALQLQCHGYNSTYSHRGTSFDSGLLDAITQMRQGRIRNALVGGQDEMTPAYFEMLGNQPVL